MVDRLRTARGCPLKPRAAPGLSQVAIAGLYPGLTAEQLLAPRPLPLADFGQWNYHRLVSDGVPTGFVALPGSELILARPDTVAVVASSSSLGIELSDGNEREVLALIDRSDPAVRPPPHAHRPTPTAPRPPPGLAPRKHATPRRPR